jgi:hypothetical protein
MSYKEESLLSYQEGFHAGYEEAFKSLRGSSKDLVYNLQRFNRWRRGEDERTMEDAGLSPSEIGEWIDMAIRKLGGVGGG